MKYGINTNCLRKKFSREKIVELALKAGAAGIEWGLDNLESAAGDVREMTKLTRDAGLDVIGFINSGHLWKTDEVRRWSEAVAGNAATLRVELPWYAWDYNEARHQPEKFLDHLKIAHEGLTNLHDTGKEFNLRYVVEIHSGTIAASPWGIRTMMNGLDARTVGAIWDPANMLIEGQMRPGCAVELMGEYLAYVHIKNLEWKKNIVSPGEKSTWEIQRQTVDQGMVDYEEVAFALKCVGYSGWLSFEEFVHDDEDAILKELQSGMVYLDKCFAVAGDHPVEPYLTLNQ